MGSLPLTQLCSHGHKQKLVSCCFLHVHITSAILHLVHVHPTSNTDSTNVCSLHTTYVYYTCTLILTLFRMISGATYSGVPQNVQVFRPGPIDLANPKSTCSEQMVILIQVINMKSTKIETSRCANSTHCKICLNTLHTRTCMYTYNKEYRFFHSREPCLHISMQQCM